ncbi:1-acyl-sn-glycerol-3-phosphate acyltransferase epsilon-like [Ptychodera flava]|uniref:1-acyl-sn-glycerol-3-phosphate acyltransferase epsilon-like n=1 Tax=Ptychodera flava TaxID=63121 RepID=UPI00396A5B16
MLTALVYLQALRFAVPAFVMLGTSPCYVATLLVPWRVISAILPTRWYHAVDDVMYSCYQRMVVFFYEHYTGLEVVLYGDVDCLEKKENVIYICNHQSTIDWIVSDLVSIRQGSLGHLRYVLKDGLKYFPLYGAYFAMHGGVYVKRSGQFKTDTFTKRLEKFPKHNIPLWLVIFPEGTRYNPELPDVIKKSQGFAYSSGLTVLNQVLTPRVKATAASLHELRNYIDAVYDCTIAYEWKDENFQRKPGPGMTDFLTGCCSRVHVHIRRVKVEDVPVDTNECRQWLHDAFEEKDIMLEDFYSNDPNVQGRLPGEGQRSPLSLMQTVPALIFWSGLLTAFLATEKGRSAYWKSLVFGTLGGCLLMAATT